MLFDVKSIKSAANKVLNKSLHSGDDMVAELKPDAWRTMYPFFCNQALSTQAAAIESLKILDVLIDYGIVGDYKSLQKVLLHKSDEVAYLALDILRKIKGLTIKTTDGFKLHSAESSVEGIEKVPLKINQHIKEIKLPVQTEKDLQNRIFNVLKREDSVPEKMPDIEEKIDETEKDISKTSNLLQGYNDKFKDLEDSIEELKKLVDSNIVNKNVLVEKAVAGKLTDVEKKIEKLCKKTSKVPSNLIQNYDNKFKALEDGIEELKKLVDSSAANENALVEKAVAGKLTDVEKKIEKLCQKTSEVPSNLIQNYDSKFKALEDSIEELKKLVDSSAANENVLAKKVAEQVLEGVKSDGHISKPEISSISQFAQKLARDSHYDECEEANLLILDNTPETSIILLNWVKFLMEKVGRNNLADILEYYVEIGWISEEVSSMMANYANGIECSVEKPAWNLPEVHTKSLLFIEQLRRRKKYEKLFHY